MTPLDNTQRARSNPSSTHIALVALVVGLIIWWKGPRNGLGDYTSEAVDWDDRRKEVKEAFIMSWDAYSEHAWG